MAIRRTAQRPLKPGVKKGEYEYMNPTKLETAKRDLKHFCAKGDPEDPKHVLIAYLRKGGYVKRAGKKIPHEVWKEMADKLGLKFRKPDLLERVE